MPTYSFAAVHVLADVSVLKPFQCRCEANDKKSIQDHSVYNLNSTMGKDNEK